MAQKGNLSFVKRQREIKKKEIRQEKLEKRKIRNEEKKIIRSLCQKRNNMFAMRLSI